ncbi:hypothetical protein FRC02_005858 [Tulasnella sp. 418]|nr:hypothetical protein FRC02_005858 [Tulasnella sp. 418]
MLARATLLLLTLPGLLAFSDTTPFLAWSSVKSRSLDLAASSISPLLKSTSSLHEYFRHSDICEHQAVVVVLYSGLHASDLRNLSPSSHISTTSRSAPSSLYIPYTQATGFELSRALAENCGSTIENVGLRDNLAFNNYDSKYVFVVEPPEVSGAGQRRRALVQDFGEQNNFLALVPSLSIDSIAETHLSDRLKEIATRFPSHLVVLSGTSSSEIGERHIPDSISSIVGAPRLSSAKKRYHSQSPRTTPNSGKLGGVFKKYQLLTPGLITTLGITFFLVFPILYFVINALSSIKSPLRSEGGKQPSAEKKNQ